MCVTFRMTSNIIVEVIDSPCLPVGNNVTLRCQPDGVPRSQVTWFQDSVELSSSDTRYRSSDDPDFTITIPNADSTDAETYTCNAMNTPRNRTVSETIRGSTIFGIACGTFAVYACIYLSKYCRAHASCCLSHLHTHRAQSHNNCSSCYAAVPPTITEAPADTVGRNPMLTAEQELSLTCSAMGTPRSQICWYREDSHIFNSSETETDIGANTLVSMLVVSSV